MTRLVECVPNFSEGCDLEVVEAIRDAIAGVPGTSILDVSSDASHNRSVITFVVSVDRAVAAALAGIRTARDRIDIRRHSGVHPRIGAADVVPFVPLPGTSMDECIALARELGARVAGELGVPVYLYERAALRPERSRLADIRRGGIEELARAIGADPARAPDLGPAAVHPTAGAVAIGARPFLIAYNAYIGDAAALPIAREIARAIRESATGGLPGVRALGLVAGGEAQVSINITDLERATLADVFGAVDGEARARGAGVAWSEIIGLVPSRALADVAGRALRLRDRADDHVLERRIAEVRPADDFSTFLDAIATGRGAPGGGSGAAVAAATAAALVAMVAGITSSRERFAAVHDRMRTIIDEARSLASELDRLRVADAEAYARVMDARRRPAGDPAREGAIAVALRTATEIPARITAGSARIAELAAEVAEIGVPATRPDAGVAAQLALAAARGASYSVHANAAALDEIDAAAIRARVDGHVASAVRSAASVTAIIDGGGDSARH